MVQRIPNPGSGGIGAIKPLGTASYLAPGTFTVTPPSGTKFVRMLLRGAGGGGGHPGQSGGYILNGAGGGKGALQRQLVRIYRSSFQVIIGTGGAAALAGGASSALGFVAAGGAPGQSLGTAGGAGGVGTSGAETPIGYGNYSGPAGGSQQGAGYLDGSITGYAGNGGNGGYYTEEDYVDGATGGHGCALLEFLG